MAAIEIFTDQPSTTTTGSSGTTSPSAGTQETWTVTSSTSFPAANSSATPPTQFHIVDALTAKQSEIITVTNVSGTTWTVIRGVEGTTPVAHNTGATFVQVVTSGWLNTVGGQYFGYPWQFYPENFGAKGDGQMALVSTTASSAVINTTPLAAPASPTVSNSGSGGTIAAGVYQVEITYVNQWGETVASASASTTTSGSTSTITINSPAPSGNATGWYAYVTQAGGSTYFRQQTPGSPTAIEVPLILTAPPTNSGANPPGANTSAAQVFTSTAVDGGKNIMICGGLGSPGAPWIDTIASVQSATQATLSSNGGSQGGNVTATGCAMVFSTDDRVAIDNCVQAAAAYALLNDNFFQVIFGSKIYGLGSSFFQTTAPNGATNPATLGYNTQVRIPSGNQSGQAPKLEAQFLGPGDNAHCYFWVGQVPSLLAATFVSYSLGPTTASATFGQQSVIGTPTGGTNFNNSNGFANVKAVIKGIQVVQPGWSNSIGIDLSFAAGYLLRGSSQAFAPTSTLGGAVNPSSGWLSNSFWQGKIGIGVRLSNSSNNDDCLVESLAIEGITTGLYTQADHAIINRLATINVYDGIHLVPQSNSHDLTIGQWSFENVQNVALFNSDSASNPASVNIVMDGENSAIAADIKDTGNSFHGVVYWNDVFRSPATPTVTGAANLKIINTMAGPGHMGSPPSVPGSTSNATLVYRDAWVVVHTGGGVTVSAVTIDGTATGLTMAASSSLAVRVPSGKTIALTYAGGTPTWDWWLD